MSIIMDNPRTPWSQLEGPFFKKKAEEAREASDEETARAVEVIDQRVVALTEKPDKQD